MVPVNPVQADDVEVRATILPQATRAASPATRCSRRLLGRDGAGAVTMGARVGGAPCDVGPGPRAVAELAAHRHLAIPYQTWRPGAPSGLVAARHTDAQPGVAHTGVNAVPFSPSLPPIRDKLRPAVDAELLRLTARGSVFRFTTVLHRDLRIHDATTLRAMANRRIRPPVIQVRTQGGDLPHRRTYAAGRRTSPSASRGA
jgi:hypothetical protein